MKNRHANGRLAGIFFLAFAVLACARAWGYTQLGSDRVLLMNNDTNVWCQVSCQGYNDTDTSKATYWVHSTESTTIFTRALKVGLTHTLYRNDGTPLWHLVDCRAGSGSSSAAGRNYIKWSATSESINTTGLYDPTSVADIGSVIMCNSLDAAVYSPYYSDGIGAIYFDAVNAYTNVPVTLGVEFATNTLSGADLSSVNYDQFVWHSCSVDVLTRTKRILFGRVSYSTVVVAEKSEDIVMDTTREADTQYYRIRVNLFSQLDSYRGPIRFRIVRKDKASTTIDTAFALVDNIVASYPPMTAEIVPNGTCDLSAEGSDVLGYKGAFVTPFLAKGQTNVQALARCTYVTNGGEAISDYTESFVLSNAQVVSRWRYLNQQSNDWQTVDLTVTNNVDGNGTWFYAAAGIDLPDGVGDWECYFTADQSAPHYQPVDFTSGISGGTTFGSGWSEELTKVVSRAPYTADDALPSGGTDWFTRIREGESDIAHVRLVGSISTNAVEEGGERVWLDMHDIKNNAATNMTLVGDHTWRYHYYVPTNCAGGKLRFHFEGERYAADGSPFVFLPKTEKWYSNATNAPYLPYTVAASGDTDIEVALDASSTHLQIEFNDAQRAFTIAHATYQDFNTWTDATAGYRGDSSDRSSVDMTGDSDAKERYEAAMGAWDTTSYANPTLWQEQFDIDENDYARWPVYEFRSTWTTPNGWSAANGMYVPRQRAIPEGRAFQMQGQGLGSFSLDGLSYAASPRGVGTVRIAARIAQTPDFGSFAYNFNAGTDANYAIGAKVTMSSKYLDATLNPDDISPSTPSVSLVGYLRGQRNGCYEFRVTRTASRQLAVALYRWRNLTATLLAQNIVGTTNFMASGQSAYDVGKPINSAAAGDLKGYDGNMLVPASSTAASGSQWTCMLFSLCTVGTSVRLDGYLSTAQNVNDALADAPNIKRVVAYVDPNSDLRSGAFGLGSVGCKAGFGRVIRYNVSAPSGTVTYPSVDLSAPPVSTIQDATQLGNWDYLPDRWEQLQNVQYGVSGLSAVVPTNQTVKLMFARVRENNSAAEWFESGWETNVASFATNTYVFAPCVAPTYRVRLQTGGTTEDVRTDVVVDDVEVTAWRATDMGELMSRNGRPEEWVYTMGSIEAAAEIEGSPYQLYPAGDSTNGYVFVFTNGGATVTFTPTVDMTIDRVLLVGGGGAGGNVMGGGGGGGEVRELDWTAAPVTAEAGVPFSLTVGAGGAYNGNNNQNAGSDGGTTRLAINGAAYTAAGGGGGGGWGSTAGRRGASGGGGSNQAAGGAATAGFAGGAGANGRGGGGGGAGAAGGDYVLGWTDAAHTTQAARNTQNPYGAEGGKGGDGKSSDITGRTVYYGAGGGGGAGWDLNRRNLGGEGGAGGGGKGANSHSGNASTATLAEAGTPGTGGGGGGGGGWNGSNNLFAANRGGAGGSGCVILRVRSASKMCVLQPTRNYPLDDPDHPLAEYPMGLRSPYMANGLSVVSFSWRDADTNANLVLQICTNLEYASSSYTPTISPATEAQYWTTVTNWNFADMTPAERKEGTRPFFMSLRAPLKGMMRLVLDPQVVSNALALAENEETRNLDYGKITITKVFCYDEPALDDRSWWGWNMHTRGWNIDAADDTRRWAYLTDSPSGLSCSLNFSAKQDENDTAAAATRKIGIVDLDDVDNYAKNNPFVQSPAMTNGIGSVSFRARTFETAPARPSVVLLYGTTDPSAYQPDPTDGQSWERLAEFVVTNSTYQTYEWKTTLLNSPWIAVRLEVGGARNGRSGTLEAWEKPDYAAYQPIERVFLDEITVAEPVAPRLKFFDVRPFRSGLTSDDPKPVADIASKDEQPLLGESWGIQARIEPQQMTDELDIDSMKVYMAVYAGDSPWGYVNWTNRPECVTAELVCVDSTNHIYRSTYANAASVLAPVEAAAGQPYGVVQYHVWAEYARKGDGAADGEPQKKLYRYDLSGADWTQPSWYWPVDLNQKFGFGSEKNFSAYSLFDEIPPGRAWFNEVNYFDSAEARRQFIELMVPENVDLAKWRIRLTSNSSHQGDLASLGMGDAVLVAQGGRQTKLGRRNGVDSTNGFVAVALATPQAKGKGLFADGQVDGYWENLSDSYLHVEGGALKNNEAYGLELVRPSGIVEHQVVVQGTNMLEGGNYEWMGSGTNLAAQLVAADGTRDGGWFFAGQDLANSTLGVWRGHGEELWQGAPTWTNDLTSTPGELNLRNGVRQFIDDYMLHPYGTNVWIYARVLGDHTWQYVNGNPASTNRNAVIVLPSGSATNIWYVVDGWYQLTNCVVSTAGVARAVVPTPLATPRTFEIRLDDVSETTTVEVGDAPTDGLKGYIADDDPHRPAVLDWLLRRWPDKDVSDFQDVEIWKADGTRPAPPGIEVPKLSLVEMYLLDIPPVGPNWVLLSGISEPIRFRVDEEQEDGTTFSYNNSIVGVKMLITNVTEDATSPFFQSNYPPYTIQGLEPGTSSARDFASMPTNWPGGTFKVTGAVDTSNLKENFLPLRWFVFDENSFTRAGEAYIEIPDQTLSYTPGGGFYGWGAYPDTLTLFKTLLDDRSSGVFSTQMLRPLTVIHTNELPAGVVSP